MVEVGIEREHAREGIVGRERHLDGLVSAGGLGAQGLDVAAQRAHLKKKYISPFILCATLLEQ